MFKVNNKDTRTTTLARAERKMPSGKASIWLLSFNQNFRMTENVPAAAKGEEGN